MPIKKILQNNIQRKLGVQREAIRILSLAFIIRPLQLYSPSSCHINTILKNLTCVEYFAVIK